MGKDDLKKLIAQARLDEAIDRLLEQIKAYSPSSKSDKSVGKLSDILIINSGKLHGLQHDKMLGIVDRQNEQLILAQVHQAILYVIDELPDEFWNVPLQRPTTKQNSGNEQTELLEAVESLKQVQPNEFEYDLFVSFSSLDREVLQPVVEKLRGYGLRVFISDQNLKDYAGISFSETIQNALENSQHFVLVSSPNSAKSGYVTYEYETFFNQFHVHDRKNRRIFVLKGNGFDLKYVPLFFKNTQFADNAEQIVNTLVSETKAQQRLKMKDEELRIKDRKIREAEEDAEKERIENEKQAKFLAEQRVKEIYQKEEQDRLEQQKLAEEQAEKQRLAAQKAEEERIEKENNEKFLTKKLLKEKQEQDRLEQQKFQEEKAEQQRLAAQKAEEERIENRAKYLAEQQVKEKQQKAEQERLEQQKLEEEKTEQQRLSAQKAEEEQSMPVFNQQPTSAETHGSLQDPAASLITMNPSRKKLIYLLSPLVLIALLVTIVYFSTKPTEIIQTPVQKEQVKDPTVDTNTQKVEQTKPESTVNQQAIRDSIAKLAKQDEDSYKKATAQNTIEAFNGYMIAFPGGKYVKQAKQKIDSLQIEKQQKQIDADNIEKDESSFNKAISQNTLEAFDGYLKAFPGGKYTAHVKQMVDSVQIIKRQKQIDADNAEKDESSYNKAISQNTVESFDGYMKAFPGGKYIKQAKQHIDAINEVATHQMVLVKGGEFMMGDDNGLGNEKPAHKVVVSDFYIGKYEVTQKEWIDIMGTNPSYFKGCDNCPVEYVSWDDVQEFLKKLNQKIGKTYRLPTEAEWEYACRAGTTTPFNTGNNLTTSQANYNGNINNPKGEYREKTMPVGSFAPNALGLCDMHGNVWEWCGDWYDEKYYISSPHDNPKGPSTGSNRVVRGGGWSFNAQDCRSAYRFSSSLGRRNDSLGFRLVFVP